MEGVGEHHLRIGTAQLLSADALDRGRCTDRHEARGVHHAMGSVEAARARLGMGTAM